MSDTTNKYKIILQGEVKPLTQQDIDKSVNAQKPKAKIDVQLNTQQAVKDAQKSADQISKIYTQAVAKAQAQASQAFYKQVGASGSTGLTKSSFLNAKEYQQVIGALSAPQSTSLLAQQAQSMYGGIGSSVTGKSAVSSAYTFMRQFQQQAAQQAAQAQTMYSAVGATSPSLKSAVDSAQTFKKYLSAYSQGGSEMSPTLQAFGKLNGLAQEGTNAFVKFGQTLGHNVAKFGSWIVAGTIVMGVIRTIRDSIQYIYDLDAEMTNIRIVTGMTVEQTDMLTKQYNLLGQEMGATTVEIAKGSLEWFRQGKTASEAMTLVRSSLMLSKLGAMEAGAATTALTSAMNGFKLEAEQALDVVDKLTRVDAAAATSSAELAEALSRSATSAQLAGISMDKLIGFVATVSEVTRKDAGSIGESFKTIFSRLQNVKLGAFEIEEDGTITTLNDVEKALGNMGVELRNSEGLFRNMSDVLDEVAGKWESLNNVERSMVATTVAGIRQRENFLVLMENYDRALELTETSLTSAGFATERYSEYQDSLAGRTATLNAAIETLASTMLHSDLFKMFLSISTAVIKVTNALGGWSVLLPTLIMLLGMYNKEMFIVKASTMGVNKILDTLALRSPVVMRGITSLITGFQGLGMSAAAATAATQLLFGVGLIAVITLVPKLIDAIVVTVAELHERVNQLTEELKGLQTEYEQLSANNNRTEEQEVYLDLLREEIRLKKEALAIEKERLMDKMFQGTDSRLFTGASGETVNLRNFQGDLQSYSEQMVNADDIDHFRSLQAEFTGLYNTYIEAYRVLLEYTKAQEDLGLATNLSAEQVAFMAAMQTHLAEQSEEANRQIGEQIDYSKSLKGVYDDLVTRTSQISSLYREMSQNGRLSVETVMRLIEAGWEHVNLLEYENGAFKINARSLENLFEVQKQVSMNTLKVKRDELRQKIDMIQKEVEAQMRLYEFTGIVPFSNAWQQLAALKNQLSSYDKAISAIGSTSIKTLSGVSNSTNKVSDATKRQIELLERQRDLQKEIYDKRIEALREELNALNKQIDAEDRLLEIQKAQDELARAKAQRNTRVYTADQGWIWTTDPQAVAKAQEKLDEILLKYEREDKKNAIQDEIDRLSKERDNMVDGYNKQIQAKRSGTSLYHGGKVAYTGVATVHGSSNNPEWMLTSQEYPILRNLLSKMGIQSKGNMQFAGGGGTTYAVYGNISVMADSNDTIETILQSAIEKSKIGR